MGWRYPTANDFGLEIIPLAAKDYDVQAYLFNGYWEDIGTIKSFFDANLALTDQSPKFHFHDPKKPIFTSPRFLPPTKIEKCRDTMMMGADYYQTEAERASFLAEGKVPVGVGQNTKIRNCIIDKNARIGKKVIIANADNVEEADRPSEGFYIRSGITVVMKNSVIPDGAVI
ncbi:putative Glucose-1-phosphate adenylyltransferase large subunit 4, chloroplastic/amyloplastic [Cocos nucifera]|nr:putative Glucose-1-phosphate adenylyltransferase large subunit 4, chloroplastic/amyloplastic [Cocos nucifera]